MMNVKDKKPGIQPRSEAEADMRRKLDAKIDRSIILSEIYYYLKVAEVPTDSKLEFIDAFVFVVDRWSDKQWRYAAKLSVDEALHAIVQSYEIAKKALHQRRAPTEAERTKYHPGKRKEEYRV